MKTDGRRQSENVEDRRGQSAGGRLGGRAGLGGGLGLIVIVVLALVFGIDPRQFLDPNAIGTGGETQAPAAPYQETAAEAARSAFVKVVLADTEDTWTAIFRASGKQYEVPTLVLFRNVVDSGCGTAQSSAGPFYCPADQKVYLDLSFLDEMSGKLGAGGDFAVAYVIAHEIGHHIQTLLGISGQVSAQRSRATEEEANALSVKLELQADCFAGVWANQTEKQKKVLEAGDIEEAMNAAGAVGDDRLQKRARGYVVPESFTHGTSAQRTTWFKKGLQTGDTNQCDTFGAASL
ncbi:MAG: neutral zinc metallopeptidase [Alphaproteobacteria bacterium]|nr:neutral zinc metallopeptidase [Alphaproteobacteria bacterium]